MTNLKNLPLQELENYIMELGEPKFRAKQILKWMYQGGVTDFGQMANVPKALREN